MKPRLSAHQRIFLATLTLAGTTTMVMLIWLASLDNLAFLGMFLTAAVMFVSAGVGTIVTMVVLAYLITP